MGAIRALGISPGREPAVIEIDDKDVIENINFFIFRDEHDDRPITWYELEDGIDLVFGETEERRKEEFKSNQALDRLGFDVRGHAIIVQSKVDDRDEHVSMSNEMLEKYTTYFSTKSPADR